MSNGVKGSARPPTEITMHIFSKERVPAIAIKRWLGDTNSRASLVWVQQWRCSRYRWALCWHSQRLPADHTLPFGGAQHFLGSNKALPDPNQILYH